MIYGGILYDYYNFDRRATRWSLQRQKWTTTTIGLGSIPFIVKPIDIAVERGMNALIRKYYPDDIFDIK